MAHPKNPIREEARLRGEKFFQDNKPCSQGHVTLRRVCDGKCVECYRAYQAKYRAEHRQTAREYHLEWRQERREYLRAKSRRYYTENRERAAETQKQYYEANRERIRERQRQYHAENREQRREYLKRYAEVHGSRLLRYRKRYREDNRDLIRSRQADYRKRNLKKLIADAAARRARQMRATPPWANSDAIKQIYENCPKGQHVDHIVPLKSKLVCGLHVETNLQYLPASLNSQKNNKFIPIFETAGQQAICFV